VYRITLIARAIRDRATERVVPLCHRVIGGANEISLPHRTVLGLLELLNWRPRNRCDAGTLANLTHETEELLKSNAPSTVVLL